MIPITDYESKKLAENKFLKNYTKYNLIYKTENLPVCL